MFNRNIREREALTDGPKSAPDSRVVRPPLSATARLLPQIEILKGKLEALRPELSY